MKQNDRAYRAYTTETKSGYDFAVISAISLTKPDVATNQRDRQTKSKRVRPTPSQTGTDKRRQTRANNKSS